MQKQEIIFPQLWSERAELGSSNLVEMKLWEGTLYFFCVPKEIYDWCLHLSVLLSEMEILVQRMSILVKEEPASCISVKEVTKLRGDTYRQQCKGFCWVLMCLFTFFFLERSKAGYLKRWLKSV